MFAQRRNVVRRCWPGGKGEMVTGGANTRERERERVGKTSLYALISGTASSSEKKQATENHNHLQKAWMAPWRAVT